MSVVSGSIERARDLVSLLDGEERELAGRFLDILGEYVQSAPDWSDDKKLVFRREMNRLVELLARKRARAMPLAALGRAALSELSADDREASRLVLEFDSKLSLLGLL